MLPCPPAARFPARRQVHNPLRIIVPVTALEATCVDCFGTRQQKGWRRLGYIQRCEGDQGKNRPNVLINFVFRDVTCPKSCKHRSVMWNDKMNEECSANIRARVGLGRRL